MIPFGAVPCEDGVRFTVWAPAVEDLSLLIRRDGDVHSYQPTPESDGLWGITIPDVAAGDRYAYSLDGGNPRPDPASRFQPDGVHGWSAVVDWRSFRWTDVDWRGPDPRDAVIYELHVGTFEGKGRFTDVAARLEYLRDIGITVVELMPLAEFPGTRNWGYDGACLFAPSNAYGRPDDLRALADRAHALGLSVVIDVVYNHLGPEGAYLPLFSPAFFTSRHDTPWGNAVNLDDEGSTVVRELLIANAEHWIREYHADGLRLDATHALIDSSDRPLVAELVERVRRSTERRVLIYAEDHRNLSMMVKPRESGGWGLDGVWADDFHHVVRRMTAGDHHGYYADYTGSARELALTLKRGWLYVGQRSRYKNAPRGTDPSGVPMRTSVVCVQNHDQIGNRARGERLHHQIDAASWRAAIAVLLTSPMTPLLFMGQEWAASTPFQFFTDFAPEFARQVVEGRRSEFKAFPEFAAPGAAERIPDPQALSTFEVSRLKWDERRQAEHAAVMALHRALLQLRAGHPALRGSDACRSDAIALDVETVFFTRAGGSSEASFAICARLRGAGRVRVGQLDGFEPVLTTEDAEFAIDPLPIQLDGLSGQIAFARPGAILFRRKRGPAGTAAQRRPERAARWGRARIPTERGDR